MKQNKRFYEAPAMQVVELRHRQVLLTGSGAKNVEDYDDGGKIDDWSNE